MNNKFWRMSMILFLAILFGGALVVSLDWGATHLEQVQAQGMVYVNDDTCPATGSGVQGDPFCRIQDAVDAVAAGDEVLVAAGTYTGAVEITAVSGYTYTQVVFIDKNLTLRGGYDGSDWNAVPNPAANPTIVDAQGQGRPVSIVGSFTDKPTVVLEGLTLTGGDYTGLGNPDGISARVCSGTGIDCGGGLMARLTTLTLRQMTIVDNAASQNNSGRIGQGGGMYLWDLQPGSSISETSVINNSIGGNSAYGAGMYIQYGNGLTLSESTLENNKAPGDNSSGGGLFIFQPSEPVLIEDTRFLNNEAHEAGGVDARLRFKGEGLQMNRVTMQGNKAVGNGAAIRMSKAGTGDTRAAITNLLLAENVSASPQDFMSVVDIIGGSIGRLDTTLAHVTAVNNQAPTFLSLYTYYDDVATVVLTNTLLASFTNAYLGWDYNNTGALTITHTNTLTDNVTNLHHTRDGSPTFTAVNPLTGDPMLDGDYRLQTGSAAIDTGIYAGMTIDIDGDSRPYGGGFDIGADERSANKVYLPLILRD